MGKINFGGTAVKIGLHFHGVFITRQLVPLPGVGYHPNLVQATDKFIQFQKLGLGKTRIYDAEFVFVKCPVISSGGVGTPLDLGQAGIYFGKGGKCGSVGALELHLANIDNEI